MKRFFICFLSLCCVISVFLSTGCGHNSNSKNHKFETTIIQEPTCIEEGLKLLTCKKCDYKEYQTIEKIGHVYERTIFAPNCAHEGYTEYTCKVCGDSYTDNIIPKNGEHSYEEHIHNSTCIQNGYIEYICTECGDSYNVKLPLSDHFYETITLSNGIQIVRCKYCGQEKK